MMKNTLHICVKDVRIAYIRCQTIFFTSQIFQPMGCMFALHACSRFSVKFEHFFSRMFIVCLECSPILSDCSQFQGDKNTDHSLIFIVLIKHVSNYSRENILILCD